MCLIKNLLKYKNKNVTKCYRLPVVSWSNPRYPPPRPHWRNIWAAPVCNLQIQTYESRPQIQIVHFNLWSREIQSNGPNQQIFCGGRPLSYLWAVMNHRGSPEASPRFNLLHSILAYTCPTFKHPRLTTPHESRSMRAWPFQRHAATRHRVWRWNSDFRY